MKFTTVALAAAALLLPALPARATTFPDASLTPGAVVPGVTVAAVCTPGYSESVRLPRSSAEWRRIKREVYARYGLSSSQHYGHVLDHLVPIELGGAPDSVFNVWPQPYDDAKGKDYMEDALHVAVCDGRVSLTEAQRRIVHWPTALDGIRLTPGELERVRRMSGSTDY